MPETIEQFWDCHTCGRRCEADEPYCPQCGEPQDVNERMNRAIKY